jgi:titin
VKATGLRAVTVAFTKPGGDGGAPITNYRVMCISTGGGSRRSQSATQSPTRVGSMAPAQTYRCTVAAANRVGVGRASARSAPVVVRPTAPGAPTVTSVQNAGLHGVTIRFTKPGSDGGSPITSYRVACISRDGGVPHSRVASASPITVPRLTFGKRYTCTVAASNNVVRGAPSRPSKPIVPRP